MATILTSAAAFAAVDQHYLLQARQMQALSFAVHIPLVCFGIAFPTMVLFAEWRYLKSGDPLFRTLARPWPTPLIALCAVGVVTCRRRRRAAVVGPVRQLVLLARVRAHVRGRLHRRGLPGRDSLRLGRPSGTRQPLRADGAGDRALGRGDRLDGAAADRRLGGPRGRQTATGEAGRHGGARADDRRSARAPAWAVA